MQWKAEADCKRWKLLKEVKKTDGGQAPLKVALDDQTSQVRYIRIRVIHNSDNEGNYTNMSEITLFYPVKS